MRIGVMLRDIWNQTDAPGIIVLNLMDKILELDRNNRYVLFFRDDRFLDRYNKLSNVKAVKLQAPAKFLWDQVAVPWAARKEDVDLIFHPKHSLPLLTGRKTVMQLRGAEYWIFPEHFERMDLLYAKIFLPLFCRKATHLIAETNDVKKDFQRILGIPDNKLSMVYLAPNERFKVIEDSKKLKNSEKKYGLPDRFILTVTRVVQNKKYYAGKNILNAIEAYRQSKARQNVKFVIVGRQTKAFIDSRYPPSDDIHRDLIVLDFLAQEDLPALYNLADLFLFPSKYESFGIPILEAMSCGCPVITSTTFSCPEVAGDAALLVNRLNIEEITTAIDRLVFGQDLRESLKIKGLRQASLFGWGKAASETIELFDQIGRTTKDSSKVPERKS